MLGLREASERRFRCHRRERGRGFAIAIVATPDRDFIVCDACNVVVHFKCSRHPKTGYCDRCFDKYDLEDPDDLWPRPVAAK